MMKYCRLLFSVFYSSYFVGRNLITADPTTITCQTGWTEDFKTSSIPKDWINDGYCDCLFDGKDEPDTNACSGSLSWPGVELPSASRYGVYERLNTNA